jgi:hypothetical protein
VSNVTRYDQNFIGRISPYSCSENLQISFTTTGRCKECPVNVVGESRLQYCARDNYWLIVRTLFLSKELLKYTNPEHSDYDNVKNALEAMREVASSINEKKRQVENIKKIAEWQLAIEQWEVRSV